MRITETEMSNSDTFSLDLVESTPRGGVLDALTESVRQLDGYVCVFDTPVDANPSLDAALFTGRLNKRLGSRGYSGVGLASLLQTRDDLGQHQDIETGQPYRSTYTSRTLSTWIDLILPYGGITKGTVTLTGLSSFTSWWVLGLGAIEMLNAGCSMAGEAVWKIDTAGELTAGPRATIFPTATTPDVIITQDATVGDSSLRGVRGGVTGLVEDASQLTSVVYAVGSGEGLNIPIDVTTVQNIARGLDGNYVKVRRIVDANQTDNTTALSRVADAALAANAEVTKFYEVTAFDPIRAYVTPGDTIYVYDADLDVSGGTDVTYNGQRIRPVATIVRQMDWDTHSDQGVWLYRPNETNEWTDLTKYVIHRDGATTRMTVGDIDVSVVTITGPEQNAVAPPGTFFPPDSEIESIQVRDVRWGRWGGTPDPIQSLQPQQPVEGGTL